MPNIRFDNRTLTLEAGETVLSCLERSGFERPSSCRSGVCQSCLMKATEGNPPDKSQAGLKSAWKAQGLFLACVCTPTEDLTIDECGAVGTCEGRISRVEPMLADVLRVFVEVHDMPQPPLPGQFVSLVRPDDGLTRPYSIAGIDADGRLELHVAVLPDGQMSNWLHTAEGAAVQVRGPSGECFYQATHADQPLLLAGTGTGLAPLVGVVRAALAAGHQGPISLYHGSRAASGLYFYEELRQLEDQHENVSVVFSALDHDRPEADVRTEPIDRCIAADRPKLDGHRLYLCGNPDLVRMLKKRAFLAGANLQEIHSDPFVTSAPADSP